MSNARDRANEIDMSGYTMTILSHGGPCFHAKGNGGDWIIFQERLDEKWVISFSDDGNRCYRPQPKMSLAAAIRYLHTAFGVGAQG